ncbi:protein ZINC INDUCED FACILITATOR-LIKE [Trifolium repens]|nr:protein ZINC INDUCED FACILITATOR-LIKE [Trifolium repens]
MIKTPHELNETTFICSFSSIGLSHATKLFRQEHQTIGLSTVSATCGIGLIIGPAIGGYLAQPVEKYPQISAIDKANQ